MKEAAEGNTLLSVEQVPSQGEEEQFGQEQMHRQRICRNSVPLFYVRLGSHRCQQVEWEQGLDFPGAHSRLGRRCRVSWPSKAL